MESGVDIARKFGVSDCSWSCTSLIPYVIRLRSRFRNVLALGGMPSRPGNPHKQPTASDSLVSFFFVLSFFSFVTGRNRASESEVDASFDFIGLFSMEPNLSKSNV